MTHRPHLHRLHLIKTRDLRGVSARKVDYGAMVLQPVDFRELAPRLHLYLSQVCELAGISKMQLDYWTTKASIPTSGRKQRIYNYDSIVLVLLIKQGRDLGLGLPDAISTAREFIATSSATK
jgi:hypothetical protein